MDITSLTAIEMRENLLNKKISSTEIIKAHFDKIEKMEQDINAFITLTKEEALEAANRVDEKIKNGEDVGLLAGIPVAVKDNISTNGIRTTCGSKMLRDYIPPYEATVIEKIKSEDGIIVGKTNMDEFAMGSSTETSYFGLTRNPNDTERVPGGSSGGSAAAVKAEEVPLALGTDTGGSIRQPASFCGVVGIKPTYGLVSRYGVIPMANSLDQVGPFGRNVSDATLLLKVVAGYDERDSTSMDVDIIDYLANIGDDIKGMKVAIPKEYIDLEIDSNIKDRFIKAIKLFEDLGAEVDEISLPNLKYGLSSYYIISTSEISSNMSRFDGVRYGYRAKDYSNLDELYKKTRSEAFGDEVKRRIMLGTYSLSKGHADEYYKKALKVRTLIKNDFDKAFEKYDIILGPTTPNLPFKMGEITDPITMYKSDLFTVATNLAGICALSMPCGYAEGLPVGLQIIGDRFKEINILKAAYTLEKNLGGVR
ncbi:Asp-tRNA(Asn)/Glu-tRNA(Gln) amidotransferase subunit GatA [Schnuerera sp. xch1]|uniref:Asp-tRNA(Asn)/Glu-tRNA(Gln) amidotransferase subunit GatA n=1 Tax=Schnuerera sp. xch1 TaxID=2874283 RepID=UPI001CBB7A19|nr:Asp-tRNA(Asn)/Glu-tRNA(Gln) amidotransferase subunit GatA [Schnuerera sp. xch1]MBZ2175481.1 Asp-tRNA(Asn)/Glu-tRNA(Gln) amidotransferase subunit GatA [Schnuerera sp. xch1]